MPQVPPRNDSAGLLFIILILWYFTSSDANLPPNYLSTQNYAEATLNRSRAAYGVLNRTAWGDFIPTGAEGETKFLNLTGFKGTDGYKWERLDGFKERVGELKRWANEGFGGEMSGLEGRVYGNVTGVVRGKWVRYMGGSGMVDGKERRGGLNLSMISPGVEWAVSDEEAWTRNVTGKEGKITVRLDETKGIEMIVKKAQVGVIAEVKAEGADGVAVQKRDLSDGIERVDLGFDTNPKAGTLVRELAAALTVQDESSSGDGYEMRLHGVHWPNEGSILLTTTSDKFAGAYALPHFATDEDHFNSSAELIKDMLRTRLENMEEAARDNPRSLLEGNQNDGLPTPHCEYIMFAQLQPLMFSAAANSLSQNVIQELEKELRFPNGAPAQNIPELRMSTIIFSPDCGFMLESKGPPKYAPADGEHLVGFKQEIFLHKVRSFLSMLAVVWFLQTLTLKLQCKEASTPSTVGRVSIHTISMMLFADGLLFFAMSLASATLTSIFPCALLASFSGLMCVALGVRFVVNIYGVQEPERQEQERAQAAATQALNPRPTQPTPTVITAAGADTALPLPVTANTRNTTSNNPIIVPSDQDIDAEIAANEASAVPRPSNAPTTQASGGMSDFGAIYGKVVLLLTITLLTSLSSTSWPVPLRTAYTHLLSFIYLSFWFPQIKRNIVRNCRKALLWRFVIGQSVLRLAPFAYFYLYEDNVLFAQTDKFAFCMLAAWLWIQMTVLASQEILGPRWCVPTGWYESGWEYHPVLRADVVEEGGLPIGLVRTPVSPTSSRHSPSSSTSTSAENEEQAQAQAQARSKKSDAVGMGMRSVDCAICMQILEVPVVEDEGGAVPGVMVRRLYMVTPCRHVFHTGCLEGWMKFRLQCPICRESLPPL